MYFHGENVTYFGLFIIMPGDKLVDKFWIQSVFCIKVQGFYFIFLPCKGFMHKV